MDHSDYMQMALALGEKARLHAPPNPWVGCVIVKNARIGGQGFSHPPGQAHAEVNALREAGGEAKGATLYATLEPCSHYGRTPPCVNAIIEAGIREVYIAVRDPDPRVSGKGVAALEKAGIRVIQGICEEDAQKTLRPYFHHRQTGYPFTIVKMASSLDGRAAAADGTSQWITGAEAREDVQCERAYSQAILIGSGTALADRPQLTVRHPAIQLPAPPLRVLLDTRGRVPAAGPLFDTALAPTLVITACAPEERKAEWERQGAEVATLPTDSTGHISLKKAWELLGSKGVLQVFVEGGPFLQTSLIKEGIVNTLLLYVGPLLIGEKGKPIYMEHIPTLKDALHFNLSTIKKLGNTVRLDYSI
ncbi:MAG: bifunctional diaminohydroxyphosphoribosylaminopyrimidine deaminase/5-amino-6-(5-phosphoribosylamino)uracil reductase RibD [Parachlamydia sp.]|nr:bifunctional diaminohydroxyphosphoribosylaminopyrimidine deaminase/5-amino-6-(5-phosphoribosylamino)uracil reductase RibD [Parachlamydia sp.]